LGKRTYIDPALLPEARIDRMREEIDLLRRTVLSLVSEQFRVVLYPPHNFTQEEGRRWYDEVVSKIIELVEPDEWRRAACPLCGGGDFTVPNGLERHLLGSHNVSRCEVMHAARGLQRVRFKELYPGVYGPYGCD
jgi:hypothetical protein